MLDHHDIARYLQDQGLATIDSRDLAWICEHLITAGPARSLSLAALHTLDRQIAAIPTGRQRLLRQARDRVLLYLGKVCEWTLPTPLSPLLVDHDQQWMAAIQGFNEDAGRLRQGYRLAREHFLRSPDLSLGFLLTMLMVEVAPLPLRYWQAVLASRAPVTCFEGQFTLEIPHPSALAAYASRTQPSITRLPLSAFAYRVLTTHLAQQDGAPTLTQILRTLDLALAAAPYGLAPRSAADWQRTALALWHHHHQVPPDLLRDISDPMRHVATLPATTAGQLSATLADRLFQPPPGSSPPPSGSPTAPAKTSWPHLALIAAHRAARSEPPAPPALTGENLVPALLYRYVADLMVDGGIKQPTLPADTIARYSNFYRHLPPLSVDQAADPEALVGWAHASLAALDDTESQQWHFFQFLRSIAQQSLTDHLDLGQFERPTLPARIDAFRLSTAQVHQLISALIGAHQGHALQRLFAAVAVLLGYYGALRRGEVLRLRVSDIRTLPHHPDRVELVITRTREGRPKNRQTRRVYPVLPEIAAKLLRVVLRIHAHSDGQQPLLGCAGESMSSRAAHYLYPVTQGLKGLFGQQARFHHLRHAGAELLTLQGLHLAYQRDETHLAGALNDRTMQAQLTPAVCRARFDFWLEGRDWAQVNDAMLLDVISAQLGHAHYATTRRHYLHGLERIMPLCWPRTRPYCRDELRYVLGMSVGSNDISRVLAQLCPGYAPLSHQAKKAFVPMLSEDALFARIVPNAVPLTLDSPTDPQAWLQSWLKNAPQHWQQTSRFELFNGHVLRRLADGSLDMITLSRAWRSLGEHRGWTVDGPTLRALRTLGMPQITAVTPDPATGCEDALTWLFRCGCNRETAQALATLRQLPMLAGISATLTLIQNRKSLHSTKWDRVRQQFARRQDRVVREIVAQGPTQLQIQFDTRLPAALLKAPLQGFFNSMLLSQPQQDVTHGQ
ncbi:TPA: hypothetical protein ACSP2D_003760 [Aeromonas veronii]